MEGLGYEANLKVFGNINKDKGDQKKVKENIN